MCVKWETNWTVWWGFCDFISAQADWLFYFCCIRRCFSNSGPLEVPFPVTFSKGRSFIRSCCPPSSLKTQPFYGSALISYLSCWCLNDGWARVHFGNSTFTLVTVRGNLFLYRGLTYLIICVCLFFATGMYTPSNLRRHTIKHLRFLIHLYTGAEAKRENKKHCMGF